MMTEVMEDKDHAKLFLQEFRQDGVNFKSMRVKPFMIRVSDLAVANWIFSERIENASTTKLWNQLESLKGRLKTLFSVES